jgi:hypothetical protein
MSEPKRGWTISTEAMICTLLLLALASPAVYLLSVGPLFGLVARGCIPNEVYGVYVMPLEVCIPATGPGGPYVRWYLGLWAP